ncbi:hypothetical protein CGRA01v4_15072 [Colletotrichum graminicola]|nr:hypothetical protein CGRA01v4_15072 [Colletotrichum graminicola]
MREAEEGTFANESRPLTGQLPQIPFNEDDRWWVRMYGIFLINVILKPPQALIWVVKPFFTFLWDLARSSGELLRNLLFETARLIPSVLHVLWECSSDLSWIGPFLFLVLLLWIAFILPWLIIKGIL